VVDERFRERRIHSAFWESLTGGSCSSTTEKFYAAVQEHSPPETEFFGTVVAVPSREILSGSEGALPSRKKPFANRYSPFAAILARQEPRPPEKFCGRAGARPSNIKISAV